MLSLQFITQTLLPANTSTRELNLPHATSRRFRQQMLKSVLATGLLLTGAASSLHAQGAPTREQPIPNPPGLLDQLLPTPDRAPKAPLRKEPPGTLHATARVRPACPVRLGGLYTLGLGENETPLTDSTRRGTPLSADNQRWLTSFCDVVALDAVNIRPGTFSEIRALNRLFTPLLYLSASTIFEQPGHRRSIAGWKPEMTAWELPATAKSPVGNSPGSTRNVGETGAHTMDMHSPQWAAHWRKQAGELVGRFGAQGVLAVQLPTGTRSGATAVAPRMDGYTTDSDRIDATADWLRAVHDPTRFMLIPSGLGFDALTGKSTLPSENQSEPELMGRGWDEFNAAIDGAWCEGWVRPYWTGTALSEQEWEVQLEAADRAVRIGQVFIASAAYHNAEELEYALASYLLVSKSEGRMVFQPLPLGAAEPAFAGFSLAAARREVEKYDGFFNAPIGIAVQERHMLPTPSGNVWRRAYQFGEVYVNSDDRTSRVLAFGSPMRRLDGSQAKSITLPPHTGAVLLYMKQAAAR